MPSYVVTGASRGLGYAFIKHLSSIKGNTVIGLVRDKVSVEKRLAKDNLEGIHILGADLTDVKALEAAAAETSKITGGSLDYLINNGALTVTPGVFQTIDGFTSEAFAHEMNLSFQANSLGPVFVINAFLPLIRAGRTKKVVNISTGMADGDFVSKFGIAVTTTYAISKAAANMVIAKYHASLGKREGILFFSVSPGVVDTHEEGKLSEEEMAAMDGMKQLFSAYAPHFTGPIQPQESVEKVLSVLEKATVETAGGEMLSHFGNKQWL